MNDLYTHYTTRLVDNKFIAEEIANFRNGNYPDNLSFLALKREIGNNTRYEVFLAIEEDVSINHSFLISTRRLGFQNRGFHRVFGKDTPLSNGVSSLRLTAEEFETIKPFVQVFDSIEEIAVAMGSEVAYYYQKPE